MKLSVCIFTYNQASFIGEAIESVIAQVTDFDFEILIGDDYSTDGTRAIIAGYQRLYPNKVRVIFNNCNIGLMANYANTILQGRGDYLAIMDGDDYWTYSGKLQAQVDFLESNPDYVLCFHDAKILKLDGSLDTLTCCGRHQKQIIGFNDIICDTHIPTSSLVFRRNALIGFPPPWFYYLNAPDRPLFLILTAVGAGFYFDQCWGVYRKHLNGHWTSQNYQSQWLTHLKIYRVMRRHFKDSRVAFCCCECRVDLELANTFLRHKRFRRAVWFLKKYQSNNRKLGTLRLIVWVKSTQFWLSYILRRLWSNFAFR